MSELETIANSFDEKSFQTEPEIDGKTEITQDLPNSETPEVTSQPIDENTFQPQHDSAESSLYDVESVTSPPNQETDDLIGSSSTADDAPINQFEGSDPPEVMSDDSNVFKSTEFEEPVKGKMLNHGLFEVRNL